MRNYSQKCKSRCMIKKNNARVSSLGTDTT
jgi:hypothetical protein